jgi:hypothetical protein
MAKSWRITSPPAYKTGEILAVEKKTLQLPPRNHHLRPAGLDVVGTMLFWVDYVDQPLDIDVLPTGVKFYRPVNHRESMLWPEGVFDDTTDELSLLEKLFMTWGESRQHFSGNMVCAVQTVSWGRPQMLRCYDYKTGRKYDIPFVDIVGETGPWRGSWRAPWILPWGCDDDGNLLFKIIDTITVNGNERPRCVQTSFNLDAMRRTFSVEIMENIQFTSPWNFQLFSDQCWGYPVLENDDIWCVLRDLRDGNLVRRIGPLNRPGCTPSDYIVHISMFQIIFQDKSVSLTNSTTPAPTPLRIFSIKPVPPAIHRSFNLPSSNYPAQLLYELNPPPHPSPPKFWSFGGEDGSERYLFFQGSRPSIPDLFLSEDWKKWAVWDSEEREWTVLQCRSGAGGVDSDGFFCLFRECVGGRERVGLDWVRMELSDLD